MHSLRRLFHLESRLSNVYKRSEFSAKAGADMFHLTEDQTARVEQRDREIRKQHLALPSEGYALFPFIIADSTNNPYTARKTK